MPFQVAVIGEVEAGSSPETMMRSGSRADRGITKRTEEPTATCLGGAGSSGR